MWMKTKMKICIYSLGKARALECSKWILGSTFKKVNPNQAKNQINDN